MALRLSKLLLLCGPALALALQPGAHARVAATHRPAPLLSARHQTVVAAAAAAEGGGASVSASTVNLAKNIVGSGVLSLAAGIAAFSGSPVAILPAFAVLLFLGAISGYTFSSIARVGSAVGASTYRDTWAKLFPKSTAIVPAATVLFMTVAAGLSYSIIIGDSFASIATLAGAPKLLCLPNTWLVLMSAFVLLPLSLLRDLSSLAVGSVIGTAGTLYTALFMTLRCIDRSYAAGGAFNAALPAASQPLFYAASAAKPLLNPSVFVLVSMLATAFLAHYNAPKLYAELAPPKDGGSKLPAFNLVCAGAFGLASLLMGSIMSVGFLTFGANAQGNILNSYATGDALAFVARLGIGASIVFSYPLNFAALREGALGILGLDGTPRRTHIASTVLIMLLVNGAGLFIKDLGLIVALGGAILGSALIYIYPALMFIANGRKQLSAKRAAGEDVGSLPAEIKANYGLLGLGGVLAIIGAIMSLK